MKRSAASWGRRFSRDERGSVFLIVGTFLVLLLFVGMATDFGILLRHRRAMQNACDSAVLAGAQDLKSTTRSATTTAQTYAQRDLTENSIVWNANNFSAQTQDKNGNATGTSPVRLWASYQLPVPLFFLAYATPSVTVRVQCAAQIVPAGTAGLYPLGMNFNTFNTFWSQNNGCTTAGQTGCFTGCPLIGAPLGNAPAACATDYQLTVGTSGGGQQQWGSGNSGTLEMSNTTTCGTQTTGAAVFACVLGNGSGTTSSSTPPPPYCTTPPPTGLNYPNGGWNPCSIVPPKTGVSLGTTPHGSNTYGTGIAGGIGYICQNYANPYPGPTSGKTWVIVLPLINPNAFTAVNGSSQPVDIVAFANFELDCPAMQNGATLSGSTPFILGRFVSWICDTCVAGNPSGVDTGVETIILVQ